MLGWIVAAMMAAAGASGDGSARSSLTSCLHGASSKAAEAKVDAAGFPAFARQTCASEAGAFRNWVIAYDMKAGWTRAKAGPDADQQVGDYVDEATDRFKDEQSAKK